MPPRAGGGGAPAEAVGPGAVGKPDGCSCWLGGDAGTTGLNGVGTVAADAAVLGGVDAIGDSATFGGFAEPAGGVRPSGGGSADAGAGGDSGTGGESGAMGGCDTDVEGDGWAVATIGP